MTAPEDWKEPGAYPVADGVHRVPLSLPMDGLKAVNVYVMESDAGLTLIDGGWALDAPRQELESALKLLGYQVGDITRFLVTHAHRDHYTLAAAVRSEFGNAEVRVGIGEKPTFDIFNSGALDSDPTIARLRVDRRPPHRRRVGQLGPRERPRLLGVGLPRRVDHRRADLRGRQARRCRPSPPPVTPGALRLHRRRQRSALRRRPRPAHHHALGRLRDRLRRQPAE